MRAYRPIATTWYVRTAGSLGRRTTKVAEVPGAIAWGVGSVSAETTRVPAESIPSTETLTSRLGREPTLRTVPSTNTAAPSLLAVSLIGPIWNSAVVDGASDSSVSGGGGGAGGGGGRGWPGQPRGGAPPPGPRRAPP